VHVIKRVTLEESPVGNHAFRGVRDKSEQMDVKKENNLAVMPRKKTEPNRRKTRRLVDEKEAGSIGRKPAM